MSLDRRAAAEPPPLGRWRASVTVVYAGAAFLAIGGFLEQFSAASEAGPALVTRYWLVFFAVNAVAFGGAALLGGLPQLAVRWVKWIWVVSLALLYGWTFMIWQQHQPLDLSATLSSWARRSASFLPAAVALLSGLLWKDTSRPRSQ